MLSQICFALLFCCVFFSHHRHVKPDYPVVPGYVDFVRPKTTLPHCYV